MGTMIRRYGAYVAVAVTATACLIALVLRTEIRARIWASQLRASDDPQRRAALLTALCNVGGAARWGITSLLNDEQPDVRAMGVVALHHQRAGWARDALLERLDDRSNDVCELAALGLAIHGDAAVVPALEARFRSGALRTAQSAALALERLALPESIAALQRLDDAALDADRRATLADALRGIAAPACVPALLRMLDDDRAAAEPPRSARMASRVLARAGGGLPQSTSAPAGAPPGRETIAEAAADGLARITGLRPAFSSTQPATVRAAAADAWRTWLRQADTTQPSQPSGD